MLSIQPIDCIKELLQMVVGPPVSTSCPFTFSYFQLFITLSRYRLFFAKCLMQLDISLKSKKTSLYYHDKLLKCTVLPRLTLSTILSILLKSPIASKILKPGSGIWHRLPQRRMPFLPSPQTLSQTWPHHGESDHSSCRAKRPLSQGAGLNLPISSCTSTMHSSSPCKGIEFILLI